MRLSTRWLAPVMALLGNVALMIALSPSPQIRDFNHVVTEQPQRQDLDYATRIRPEHLSDAQLSKALDLARTAGVDTIDFEVSWPLLDRGDRGGRKRACDWHEADGLVSAARARGMRGTFLLAGTPDWVHPYLQEAVPNKNDRAWTAPKGERSYGIGQALLAT